jgi:GT2 family glycosyltransferase
MQVFETAPLNSSDEGVNSRQLPALNEVDYSQRVEAKGKFLFTGNKKYWVKGVTYGTFRPGEDGEPFPPRETVRADFEAMLLAGINTVRTYTPPPRWLLNLAQESGLRVMVGLSWEQHVTFLDDKARARAIERRVQDGIRACDRHPAILCYALGNEIPASIVRWHGRRKIEKFIHRLYRIAKTEDPECLVTYVNYPTTEYLQLQFLDLMCFNLYLESEDVLKDYVAKLQNLAGRKPLLMTEIGLDSQRNGEIEQAKQLENQIRSLFSAGCAGSFVFAWTDEWYRGGSEIEDWDFGLCSRDRQPKPALMAVRMAYQGVPFPADTAWPKASVVVCSCNGEDSVRDTLEHLAVLDYPDYEVIVVNDGSSDRTAEIVSEFDVHLISTENRGLSNARNLGWRSASGEIIAFIDDDAYPDPHWLSYLAHTFLVSDVAAVGGLSPAPAGDGPVADCVANAPGRPVHVLLTNTGAEHIPGCNLSFRRQVLEAIDGFDPRFRAAGDDVDVCWRILENGWKIGFQAGALNWHHSRDSFRAYWKQQKGYGKAEALLEEKWPQKYNSVGHLTWRGRIYSNVYSELTPFGRGRIYQGQWGSAPFQSIYAPARPFWPSLLQLPEWFFIVGLLGCLTLLGLEWPPLLLAAPLLVISLIAPIVHAISSVRRAELPTPRRKRWQRIMLKGGTALLILIQPLARLSGRVQHGLTPWRRRVGRGAPATGKLKRKFSLWSEDWTPPNQWLTSLESLLNVANLPLNRGGDFDHWDLEISGGFFGRARLLMAVEDHEGGKQYARISIWPRVSAWALGLSIVFGAFGVGALFDGAFIASGILLGSALMILHRIRREALTAAASFSAAVKQFDQGRQNAG